ncbi:AI-2E family transporter [Sulfurimonas sp.]|uniref:AI-2E family transporter n=1 Tax=Sulfurimonas sp. TaxID=2022749 RepID=UPI0035668239
MENHKIGYSFLVMASVVIVLAGIKSASEIVVPFLLSLFLAIILSPMYNFFRKKGLADSLSLTLVIGVFSLFLVLVANMLGSSTQDFSSNIDFYQTQLLGYFKEIDTFASSYGVELPISELSNTINSKQIMLFTTDILQSMGSMFANGFVVLFTLIFMLLESSHFMEKISYAKGIDKSVKYIEEISTKIKKYMVLKALMSLLTGFIIWLALLLIGTDYAFLWAFLAFLLNFIPNIGSIIAAVPAVLLTLVQLGGISASLVAVVYLIVNVVIGSILEPKVMGKGLGLSTLIVFLSLLFWGWLLGTVGMLLSIPLTIMAKIALDTNENTKWIAILLGSGEHLSKADNK